MKAKKFYINRENMVAITCPSCSGINRMPIEKFKDKHRDLKVKCPCKHTFLIDVEFKRAYRKNVKLAGSYKDFSEGNNAWYNMNVLNVSRNGIGLTPLDIHNIKEEDILKVKFTLDDDHRSEIEGMVKAINVADKVVGCQFIGYMKQNHKLALDPFLIF